MPFGAANASSEFMRLMADLLFDHIDKGYCIMFIDDILVFSRTAEEHKHHVRAVMDTIRKAGFRLHGSKCSFGRSSAPFLGFDIDGEDSEGASVRMTHEKIKAISDWPYPASPKEMRSFVGLSGVYRKFVPDFAKIAAPLTELFSVEQREYNKCMADAVWWAMVTKAVDFLKAAMIARPALALPQKGNYNYLVRTDASDFAIGATLRQLQFLDCVACGWLFGLLSIEWMIQKKEK